MVWVLDLRGTGFAHWVFAGLPTVFLIHKKLQVFTRIHMHVGSEIWQLEIFPI
jgi:hypothetical protein